VLGRARYLKALAEAARRTDVRAVAERLQTAHSATVEWISTVLAEEALGGPAALRRTHGGSWARSPRANREDYTELKQQDVTRFGPALDNRRHGAGRSVASQKFVDHF
jgi:hypothetical protein